MELDMESLKLITIIGTSSAIVLYIYRILCAIDLMRSESPKVDGMNRLIYAALIFFIPLGIGAWLYDFVVNDKKVSPLFLFPFLIVVTTFVNGMIVLMPHATTFSFDYVGW